MSQQIIEQPSINKNTTIDIYKEAEIVIRQLERFEKELAYREQIVPGIRWGSIEGWAREPGLSPGRIG
jgi:hypothetical protein